MFFERCRRYRAQRTRQRRSSMELLFRGDVWSWRVPFPWAGGMMEVMPTISIFLGVIVQKYWSDHEPPHIHAYYGGFEALLEIETGGIIAGRLPPKVERFVREWVLTGHSDLMDNWE